MIASTLLLKEDDGIDRRIEKGVVLTPLPINKRANIGRATMEHLCECGCGEHVTWNKRKKAWNKFINGHYWRGKTFSDEYKAKLSESHEGNRHTDESKRKISLSLVGRCSPMKGRKHTEETKKLMSVSQLKRTDLRGGLKAKRTNDGIIGFLEKTVKPGKSDYCDVWFDWEYKEDLRLGQCESCGITNHLHLKVYDRVLSLHHKDGDKENCHPCNFSTLCVRCHAIFDWQLRHGGLEDN